MQNYYRSIIPRLDGSSLKDDFPRYAALVRKGVAGFILFGGEVEQARHFIGKLQAESEYPLIIASDLERGLGQQLKGGTPFPPAMALAKATRRGRGSGDLLLRKAFNALAEEARYAGINVILAPVLDINTNPKNPIICTRSFGEDADTVSFFGGEMIRATQALGVAACAKHFPGHGDTSIDSHISLPVVKRGLDELQKKELVPFVRAVQCGVRMIMLGHLSVPAIDPSNIPLSISEKAVLYLRTHMKYHGLLITDAMNMGGLGGYSEEQASLEAIRAGVDLLLHPSDTEKIVSFFKRRKVAFDGSRLDKFRRGLARVTPSSPPDFEINLGLSRLLAKKAIRTSGRFDIGRRPFLLILNDEDEARGNVFSRRFQERVPGSASRTLTRDAEVRRVAIPGKRPLIVAVFSETRAWKGGVSQWLYRQIEYLKDKADLLVSFGSPYLFDMIEDTPKMFAYWDADASQTAAADIIAERCHPSA